MKIALIGYGEVGRIFAEDLRRADHEVTAFDLQLLTESPAALVMRRHAAEHGVALASSHPSTVARAALVISAVTAHQDVAAAEATSLGMHPGAFFLDVNSASPGAKVAASHHVERAQGRYVEGAIMTAVPPCRLKVPLLLGGPHAEALAPLLNELGFAAQVGSQQLGTVSATKMCRSIVIKGLEALVIESLSAARFYGVEDAVIASLQETFPGVDWGRQSSYFFQRVIEHGRRRAEEMREVAVTVREAGLAGLSATSTAERQDWVADLKEKGVFGQQGADDDALRRGDWRAAADRILAHLAATRAAGDHDGDRHQDPRSRRP